MSNQILKEGLSLNSIANAIEIGRRVILKSRSEDFRIPEGANIEEDLAAALGVAIRDRKLKEGISNVK